jgi:hypothetical protein
MLNTVKEITRILEGIQEKQSIILDAFAQLKEENAKLKQEKSAQDAIIRSQDATIKKLEQRVAKLEAVQN